jgi:hypothetical protein
MNIVSLDTYFPKERNKIIRIFLHIKKCRPIDLSE